MRCHPEACLWPKDLAFGVAVVHELSAEAKDKMTALR
jgi:hypothetical protein